jgi:hypothetical protein
MTHAYIITEAETDSEILKAVLPEMLTQDVTWGSSQGRYGIQSLASTLLATRQKPVLVVLDSDTLDTATTHEIQNATEALLGRVAPAEKFHVTVVMPELETIFFEDRALFARIFEHEPTALEWESGKYAPKQLLVQLARAENQPYTAWIVERLQRAQPAELARLRDQAAIQGMRDFLASNIIVTTQE